MTLLHTLPIVLRDSAQLLRKAAEETLWPTRCVICDMPGVLLCDHCRINLPYLDQLKACPICGAAQGCAICCECNQFILGWKHLDSFPLHECKSATLLTPETRRIVTCYKDRGERRLASELACLMANVIPLRWKHNTAMVPIPSRTRAKRERGFDHIKLIADQVCRITNIPIIEALEVHTDLDQRLLGGQARLSNMKHSFIPVLGIDKTLQHYTRIIIIDDVMTTGATLFSAADTLRFSDEIAICGLTFSRA